jgi:uncharacterized protein (DUF1778 family)
MSTATMAEPVGLLDNLRLTDDERILLELAAALNGVTVNQLLRECVRAA